AGSGGHLLATEHQQNPRWKLWPVAFVDDDRRKVGRRFEGVPVLGDTASIPALVKSELIDVVIVAIPSAPAGRHGHLVEIAQSTPARVLTLPPIGSILRGEVQATSLKTVRAVDVLGRPVVSPDRESCLAFVRGKCVLITGAAGSIGHELAMQIAQLEPRQVILLDTNETGLHDLSLEIERLQTQAEIRVVIASVTDAERIGRLFQLHRPNIVLHAAAYKHVPLMEQQPDQAVETNTLGTDLVARYAAAHGAERFVLVSTDKAVRPSSVMGATKRLAELAVGAVGVETGLSVCSVRFGNVLGSRGSVIPTFERQIRAGGPVTVTDPRMKRYFMTIPEAVSLIIQAGAFGDRNATYILDMGEAVSIVDLAKRVISLHGLQVDHDIKITFTGVRPGEKLYEELTLDFEAAHPTAHPKIRMLEGMNGGTSLSEVPARLAELVRAVDGADRQAARAMIQELVAGIDGTPLPTSVATAPAPAVRLVETPTAADVTTIGTMAARGDGGSLANGTYTSNGKQL
ncbi:MAG TPA: nucleoside-diphosphate sugar epimerase/dehydratase, partial [Thermomicrobiales bacterium]|nr:nucleoside-diphosphate sugar epimerase/dehydratase [Thermomicrobiales bacterium]